jgi:hypothetical protein
MAPLDPRMLYFFYRWRDAEMRLRRRRNGPSYGGKTTIHQDDTALSEREQLNDKRDRCNTGAGMLGVCGAIFVVVVFLMLPDLGDDPSTGTMILFPSAIAIGCFLGAAGLWRQGDTAKRELDRMDTEERTARWRAAQSERDKEREAHDSEQQNEDRMREDERRVAAVRTRYERGELREYDAPISLNPMEKCLYTCNCSGWDAKLHDQIVQNAQLVITSVRLVVVEPDSAHVSNLSDVLRFAAVDDRTVRLWLAYRPTAYDLVVDYPMETVACLLIAFKTAGITPPRPAAS